MDTDVVPELFPDSNDDDDDCDDTPAPLSHPISADDDVADCDDDDSTTSEVTAYLKKIFGGSSSSDSDESKVMDVAVATEVDTPVDAIVATAPDASTSAPNGNI